MPRISEILTRAEDRICDLKDAGLRNLPLHDCAANQIRLELVALAADLLAWTQHLAVTGNAARNWEHEPGGP